MNCQFSQMYPQSSGLSAYARDGSAFATVFKRRLIVRDGHNFTIIGLFDLLDTASRLEWSPDCTMVLVAYLRSSYISVHSLKDQEWKCEISQGVLGLESAFWAPDSRHIVCVSSYSLYLSVVSLCDESIINLSSPKAVPVPFYMSSDHSLLLVLQRMQSKDAFTVLDTEKRKEVHHFSVSTVDCSQFSVSPNEHYIAVAEDVTSFRLLVYTWKGTLLCDYDPRTSGPGIRCLQWNATSEFLAVGVCDQTVRLFNSLTWSVLTEVNCDLTSHHKPPVLYEISKQQIEFLAPYSDSAFNRDLQSQFVLGLLAVKETKLNPENQMPGVSRILWSPSSQHLAILNGNYPNILFLFDLLAFKIQSFVHFLLPIQDIAWTLSPSASSDPPNSVALAVTTGRNLLYLWDQGVLHTIFIPNPSFATHSLLPHPTLPVVLLFSKSQFCMCSYSALSDAPFPLEKGEDSCPGEEDEKDEEEA